MQALKKNSLDRLKDSRIRITNGRVLVLQAMDRLPNRRLRVEDIFRELLGTGASISLGSVYRVLKELTVEGLITRAWDKDGGDPRYLYQLADSLQADEESCEITCPQCGSRVELDAPRLLADICRAGKEAGLALAPGHLLIQATCRKCAESGAAPALSGKRRLRRIPVKNS